MLSEHESALEKILYFVGDDGRYQKIFYWTFLVPINIMIPWIALVPIFQSSLPEHWCHVSGKPQNTSLEEWKILTLPREEDGDEFSKCKQYVLLNHSIADLEYYNYSKEVTECQDGWDFDTTWYNRTLPMERKWVCQQDRFSARWLSAAIAGNIFGTLMFNTLSDHWGRKWTVIITTQVYALFGTCRLFMTSEWGLLIMMFLSSMPFPSLLQISFIWVLEQVSRDLRAQITSLACIMWTVGMCSVPFLAWLSRDWVLLGIVTSLPFIPFIIIWWTFPESPRWLLSRGRVEEAAESFEKIAQINRKKSPLDLQLTLNMMVDGKEAEGKPLLSCANVTELFRYPVLRRRSFLLVTTYTCNYLMYYIIIYNTANISGNEFLNFFLLSITELPANVTGWFCSQYIGRRFTGAIFFLLATLLSTVAIFLASSESWIVIVVLMTCKAFITVSFFVIYIQLAELYPTSHRGTGIGVASMVALIVGISGPYIAYTGSRWPPLPYVILALIGVMGTGTSLFIPETLGTRLPQTITDAEKFLADHSFWSYLGWKPKQRKSQYSKEKESGRTSSQPVSFNNSQDSHCTH